MGILLHNEKLKVKISEQGGELISVISCGNHIEFIWTGDPDYWGRHAPILFPIVGKVKDNQYRIGEKTYELGQHGFARDRVFEVIEKEDSRVILSLKWDKTSLEIYPYKYNLKMIYELKGASLKISYIVENLDEQTIYFSIGAHPGFNCPLLPGEAMEDYYFEFDRDETCPVLPINDGGYMLHDKIPFLNSEKKIALRPELFKGDALIFKDLSSRKISLKNKKNDHVITMDFDGFPLLGLWSKPSGAPFVCIEPWFGHCDYEDFTGDFSDKSGMIALDTGKKFDCSYRIDFS
ncbi:aldose 1-epimerase family protein [Petrocella sp. FN5]|uniref:aldose 1-epimerase family protein n=1 Tax=Petrocella sp. FN5 TaxID=3032002 RepID=UPI0023DAC07C|nr:aldose 1-epimerase family protein [Petrocella sp. FN5]MDF1617375.1 aldose 1-epimerase family protein [Petrocella sp. FN5]